MDLPKLPPRYVPTLTEVVSGLAQSVAGESVAQPDLPLPALSPVNAPARVAQAVPELPQTLHSMAPDAGAAPVSLSAAMHSTEVAEEQLVQRLLQRAGLVLEQRLQACIAQVVQEQTHSITLRLQQELESVVRQTLYEAVVEELAPRSPRER